MGINQLLTIVFPIIIALAAAATLQFFKGRKSNLSILEQTIKSMEGIYRPLDKDYTIIGLYVGYTAKYKVIKRGIASIEATILLIPRQSLFYLPIAKLTSRFDRVFIHYFYRGKVMHEAHVVRKGYYRLGIRREIRGIERMMVAEEVINGEKYYLIYTNRNAIEPLIKLVKSLPNPSVINHVALVPANNSLYLAAKLDMKVFDTLIKNSYELAAKLAP